MNEKEMKEFITRVYSIPETFNLDTPMHKFISCMGRSIIAYCEGTDRIWEAYTNIKKIKLTPSLEDSKKKPQEEVLEEKWRPLFFIKVQLEYLATYISKIQNATDFLKIKEYSKKASDLNKTLLDIIPEIQLRDIDFKKEAKK